MPQPRRKGWQRVARIASFRFRAGPGADIGRYQFEPQPSLAGLQKLDRRVFESGIFHWMCGQGMRVHRCRADRFDAGYFLAAARDGKIMLVQCKSWPMATVSVRQIRDHLQLAGKLEVASGMVVTCGTVSCEARALARTAGMVTLDGQRLLLALRDTRMAASILAQGSSAQVRPGGLPAAPPD